MIQAAIVEAQVELSEALMGLSVLVAAVSSRRGAIGKFALLPISVALMGLAFFVL